VFSNFFSENRAVYGIMWKITVKPDMSHDYVTRSMLIACWKSKTRDTHSKYVFLIAFPQQDCLRERVSMLRYTYIVCLVYNREGGRSLYSRSWMLHKVQFVLQVWSQLSLCGICGGSFGTGRSFPSSTAVSLCQYHRSILIFICEFLYQQNKCAKLSNILKPIHFGKSWIIR
jgi:hypothetical protein